MTDLNFEQAMTLVAVLSIFATMGLGLAVRFVLGWQK